MGFRITNSLLYRSTLSDVSRQRERLVDTQEQASSGLRVNRPSDDPAAARTASVLKAALAVNGQYERNLGQARTRVARMESAIATARDLLVRVRELALQGASDTIGDAAAGDLAGEVAQIHGGMLAEGNAQVNGAYVFSGFASTTPAFASTGPFVDGAPAPTVSFGGDPNEIETAVDESVRLRSTLNGQRVFMGDADGNGSPDAGREDVFDVVADVRDALLLPADQRGDALRTALGRIDTALGQLSTERNAVGAIDARLERQAEALGDRAILLTERLSDAQDADAARVFSDLVNQESALRASLEVTSRVIQPTLLNFLGV